MLYGVDLTACHRDRVGMVTAAIETARAVGAALGPGERLVAFASRERPHGLDPGVPAVLSPHLSEIPNKLTWLPAVEAEAGLTSVLYPYWPTPPWRRRGAPPAVVVIHDLAFRVRPREVPWQQRAYLGTVIPRALRQASAIVVPSDATRRELLECYPLGGLDARLRVVPEGPTPLPVPGPAPPGLEPGYLLAVGTIEARKNYDRLLDAYRAVRRRAGGVPDLVVAGRPGWDCNSELRRLRSEPGTRFLGHVPDALLSTLYRDCGVFLFPSLHEGFGLPLLDAMTRGVPALIGRGGALSELAGGAALEVDAEDTGSIAEGIARLLDDGALRAELGHRARVRAAAFGWDRAGLAFIELLRVAA